MNPNHIQDIITALKEDKSCVQPWRNKAVARLEEAIAFVHMGHQTTNLKPPAGMPPTAAKEFMQTIDCTCPMYPVAKDKACPVHGE